MLLVVSLLLVAACHRPEPAAESPTPSIQQRRAERAAEVPAPVQRRWTFLNRLRQGFDAIDRTRIDKHNQLGIVLSSSVTPDQVPAVMKRVMMEMAQEFPGDDIVLDAYAPTRPLRKLGSAQLDGKTEEAIYTAAK